MVALSKSLNSSSVPWDIEKEPNPCSWEGMLSVSNNKLGSIPVEFVRDCGKIDGLKQLNFSKNRLNLIYNHFTGSLPTQLGKSKLLEELQLSMNKFLGRIPEEIFGYPNLKLIDLSQNNLSGSVPDRVGELSKFEANQNEFGSVIPSGITKFLKNLDLRYNMLSGSIPSDLLSPPNLQSVDLSFNRLEGSLPVNMSSRLIKLRLGNNKLSGTIPASFARLQNLTYLELENNGFTKVNPPELGSCQSLALLNLAQNRLMGSLPVQLGKQSWRFHTQHHEFHDFPLELQLGKNQLSGYIPEMPRNLQIALNLSNNLFKGPIPKNLAGLTGLEVLDLSNNKFSGEIPSFLTQLKSLTQLLLTNNSLSGDIPKFNWWVVVEISGNTDLTNLTTGTPVINLPAEPVINLKVFIAAFYFSSFISFLLCMVGPKVLHEAWQEERLIFRPRKSGRI
ncbi:hypothetical protein FNV43_RR21087 [Rhamnella rubrinervis]|uniref:Uncharacterized protein n=1 Tax=Rhamnella rubrinervis TaxID=2594499 RepID=A0A8K0GXJ0_9ROSA|nr:hypothetical protein FNV43_RR21087 [Rhamnella rubrinervis]